MNWVKRIGKIGGTLLLLPIVGIGVHYAVKQFTHAEARGPAYRDKTVTEWIDELERPIEESGKGWGHVREFLERPDRKTAQQVLEVMGPDAVPYLIEALDDDRKSVRQRCVWVLGRLGLDGHAALPKLRTMLREDAALRGNIAWTLNEMSEPALQVLVDALGERVSRDQAAGALLHADRIPERGVKTLLRIAETDTEPSESVFRALAHESVPRAQAVDVLTRGLDREDRRLFAAWTLAEMHSRDVEVPAARVARLLGEDVRRNPEGQSLFALIRLGAAAAPAAADLATLIDHRSGLVSAWAQAALRGTGSAAAPYESDFLERAKLSDPDRRSLAIGVLGAMGPDAPDALFAVLAALEDRSQEVRKSACYALATRHDEADIVVPALERALASDANLRYPAVQALATLSETTPAALDVLVRALDSSPSQGTRRAILNALGPKKPEILVAAARSEHKDVRWRALTLLGRNKTAEAVPTLILSLAAGVREIAVLALWRLAEVAEAAVPSLEALRDDTGLQMHLRARIAALIVRIDPTRPGAVTFLSELLTSPDPMIHGPATVQCLALESLPDAVVSALRSSATDEKRAPVNRWFAVGALVTTGHASADELVLYLQLFAQMGEFAENRSDLKPLSDRLVKFARSASFDPVPVFQEQIAERRLPLPVLLIARRAVTEINLERKYGKDWRRTYVVVTGWKKR